jgi:hypothetical protein
MFVRDLFRRYLEIGSVLRSIVDLKPKKRCPFQHVPVMALATCERLPEIRPFQAKPSSSTITLSSLPFHSRTSSPPELRSIPSPVLGLARPERAAVEVDRVALRSANRTHSRPVEIAARNGPKPISENLQKQPSRQMGGSRPAQMIAPLETKLVPVESSKTRDTCIERFGFAPRRC